MKVLCICCSPRKGGNTEVLLEEALASARASGAEVELVTVAGKNIAPCDGCESCKTTGQCHIKDDMQAIYPKMVQADGIIFGTPVYFWGVTAQAKAVIDRTYLFRQKRELRNKVAGVVVVTRRAGGSHAFSTFNNFFIIHRMIAGSGAIAYARDEDIAQDERGGGVIAYGSRKGDVRQDERGMTEARALGRVVATTIRKYRDKGLI